MFSKAIYFVAGDKPDAAIQKGLTDAGCEIEYTHSIAATIATLQLIPEVALSARPSLLIAEVQAGALPLLSLLQDQDFDPPPVVLFDREGSDIQAVVKALKHNVRDYLLASEPNFQREIRVRILAERATLEPQPEKPRRPARTRQLSSRLVMMPGFNWDPSAHVIYIGGSFLSLSPVEGRVFDLLISNRNCTVMLDDLIAHALENPGVDVDHGVRLLRPHMMRLRNKLQRHPELAHRIVNLRGSGYMFI